MDARRARCYRHGPNVVADRLAEALQAAARPQVHVVSKAMGIIGLNGTATDVVGAIERLRDKVLGVAGGALSLHAFTINIQSRPERVDAARALRQRHDAAWSSIPVLHGWVGVPMGYHELHQTAIRLGGTDPDSVRCVSSPGFQLADAIRVEWFTNVVDRDVAYQALPGLVEQVQTMAGFRSIITLASVERPDAACGALANQLVGERPKADWAAEALARMAAPTSRG